MNEKSNASTDPLAPLAKLSRLQRGQTAYYLGLIQDGDPFIRVAAWRALFESRSIPFNLHEKLLADCSFAAVRSRAFDYFESLFEHSLAKRAAETAVHDPESARVALMLGQLDDNPLVQLNAEEDRFLATGEVAIAVAAAEHAERTGGWQTGLKHTVRGFVAFPQSVALLTRLLRLIDGANDAEMMRRLAAHFAAAQVYAHVAELATAIASLMSGNPADCLKRIEQLERNPNLTTALAPLQGNLKKAKAEALHKSQAYPRAYETYVELNAHDRAQVRGVNASEYIKGLEVRAALDVPKLPADDRHDTVYMVGFPRSGTTLLENALAAHPAIETFEEIPSQRAAIAYIERVLGGKLAKPASQREMYLEARRRYYSEIDRRRKSPSATVLIDKLPIRSGDAKFLVKLLPEQRYIFSIRHPFDVVLSCFKQRFAPNPAMENFHTVVDAARLYDFVMRQWFDTHTLNDPLVHYVRYDDLVSDFEPVTRQVLSFVGLEWSDEINGFAEKAAQRAARTPSYQKVRQGLSIGVQTSWQHYRFAFRGEAERLLTPWANLFGYSTSEAS